MAVAVKIKMRHQKIKLLKKFVIPGAVALTVWMVYALALRVTPLPARLGGKAAFESLDIQDRNGRSLRKLRGENGAYQKHVKLSDLPAVVIHATLASEDARFYQHGGVDMLAIGRAVVDSLEEGRIVSGASTIAQQLIKISGPKRPRNLLTKLYEAWMAQCMITQKGRNWVLEEYLNRVDYGHLQQGMMAAADFYFHKSPRDLSPSEAAFLAGLPQNPTRLNPYRNLPSATLRRDRVLAVMLDHQWLTRDQWTRALQEPVTLQEARNTFEAPHFIDFLLGQNPFENETGKILTTLDLAWNEQVQGFLQKQIATVRDRNVKNGAVVVIDNHTGDIVCMVGSENYFCPQSGQVNGAWAPRSSGSTLKPFIYALALDNGARPSDIVADIPVTFQTATGVYSPVNYNRRCLGPVTLRYALGNSLNIPAVKVLDQSVGVGAFYRFLRSAGVTSLSRSADEYGLGLAIGNGEVRLLELANLYALLGREGVYRPYRMLLGEPMTPEGKKLLSPESSFLVSDMLDDPAARALSFGWKSALEFTYPVACKTGTSSDYRDNWAVGYTPEWTVAVWVGNFSGEPMGDVSGVTGAAPLMHRVMDFLHDQTGSIWFAQPAAICTAPINLLTGKETTKTGRVVVREKFVLGNPPPREDASDYDTRGRVLLPSAYREWYASGDNALSSLAVVKDESGDTPTIRSPTDGATYYLDPDLPAQFARIPLKASGPSNTAWTSPTLLIKQSGHQYFAEMKEGTHTIELSHPTHLKKSRAKIVIMKK